MEQDTISDVKVEADDSSSSQDASQTKKADSSTADAKKTLADVVKETAAKSAESQTAKTEDEETEEVVDKVAPDDKAETSGEDEEAVVDKKEDKDLPFHKHPRFQELVKERNEFKQKVEQADPALKRDQALSTFCQQNNITNDEFVSAMEIAALLHNDPKKALESLRGYVETLELTLGNKLPADLQKEVDDGALSEARAKELANLRVKAQGLEYTGKKSEAQVHQERQLSITSAVNSWDQNKRSADPAYEKKYPLIEKAFKAMCADTPPRNAAEGVALAEKAYAEVNAALGTLVPKPPARKVLRTNGAAINKGLEIKAGTSLRDALPQIVRNVVATHRE